MPLICMKLALPLHKSTISINSKPCSWPAQHGMELIWHQSKDQNYWQKANILPTSSSPLSPVSPSLPSSSLIHASETHTNPTLQAEALVSSALDDLEATGALQRSNHMDLAEILNPV
ncbi:hypothetical protein PISMIDRAFT_12076 [Pisolithus microcarpus 441]|uniref:Unplaced genomic scaffold scaffold_63, whole genome shotgun sequence n=1 Tax=Pisolithus microcarpus 441 TaxID=765257 RepID=A0A0C9ZPX5_9AGAM|nr:hypothetical protein BKA83DRAFT_12076 [Pisolithus microcarpus]KIK21793.1 hypothetical protein PISMIDRAFT_12076 [Pisolithus microcarpus 441]